jgi:hypothetical protein
LIGDDARSPWNARRRADISAWASEAALYLLADAVVESHVRRGNDDEEGSEAHAVDPEAAERLWHVSEEMVGERFDFRP